MCGPASLKILLSHFGKDYSEKELALLCNSTIEHGTDHANLIQVTKDLGFDVESESSATIDELRELVKKDIPVIVGWWSVDDDHYSVVYDVDDEFVYLVDPEIDEPTRKIAIHEFEKIWFDFDGPLERRDEHWMMAVTKA